jgi:DNA topoisomerase I
MKKLLIVESPAKTKTIAQYLGKEFTILSTLGHIKDLPQKQLGITLNKHVTIDYVTLEGKEKTVAALKKEAKTADIIYLAPDPDREGEIIAWHVEQELLPIIKKASSIHRITFNEISKAAINQALEHPSNIDLYKVAAQQARRVLDRLVGYEVSPILWKKIAKGLSAGRVQSVALRLICDREQELQNFKPQEYWSIESIFSPANLPDSAESKHRFTAPLTHINKKKIAITTQEQAHEITERIKQHTYSIESIKDTKRLKNPAPPFMTSTLQQAAYNQLGFAVQKTMQAAQKLYEGVTLEDTTTPVALITYMRTDSLRISKEALEQTRSYIKALYGSDYLPAQAQVYSKSSGQDAHEAIRPIDITITPDYIKRHATAELAKLYELIWKRFVASQLKPAQYAQRQVTITGGPFIFKVTGSTLLFDGFLRVYNHEDKEEKEEKILLPDILQASMPLRQEQILPKQHFTQPPPRYTEASLVKELEKEGIGRPSTYATILKTIQARLYTTLDAKKRFVPTELGTMVTKMLVENLPKIMDFTFTATMEQDLDKIAQGTLERDLLLKNFYQEFERDLELFKGEQSKKILQTTDITCPTCKDQESKLVIRFGKAGTFAGCANYPKCKFTSNFERLADNSIQLITPAEPELLAEQCPQCSKPLRRVQGRFGPFTACSGYPECTYIQPVKAGFKCPQCKEGDIVQRIGKGKKFWGCTQYPACNFAIAGEIEATPCTFCANPYMLRRIDKQGNVSLICGNKTCISKQQA